jgi:dTMP kinase
MPDFTLLLDIEPEAGLQRISANSEREVTRFDKQSLDYHHRIRAGYQSMVSLYPEHNIKTIDASGNTEQVFEEGKKVFEAYFNESAVA